MDSQSHIEYAKRIVPSGQQTAALASLFPQIDRTPATLHRNYAHYLYKAKPLVELGFQVLNGAQFEDSNYEIKRFLAEKSRILNYIPDADLSSVQNKESFDSSVLAFISHLHLDTFNQPVQAFTPRKSVCSGQWKLWDEIGDFRYRLYVKGVVEELRADWLTSKLWNDKFDSKQLTSAMVYRLATLANYEISSDLVQSALKDLNLESLGAKDPAIQWLMELENELTQLHIQHLV